MAGLVGLFRVLKRAFQSTVEIRLTGVTVAVLAFCTHS
jgi:hypothetical protein